MQLEELVEKIHRLEYMHAGSYFVDTPNGTHFNDCSWAAPNQDGGGEGTDVVDTCDCQLIEYYTFRCIDLLDTIGFNKIPIF